MKKIKLSINFLTLVALLSLNASCSKDQNKATSNSQQTTYDATSSKTDVSKQIEQLRISINNNGKKSVKTLGRIQTAINYALADGAGAVSTFSKTVSFVGPGYAAAAGLLGGICGSTWLYVGLHYDFKIINPPANSSNGTNTYTNIYEQYGYMHNNELVQLYSIDNIRPTTTQEYLDKYYDMYCSDIASAFSLDLNTLKNVATKTSLKTYLDNYPTQTSSQAFMNYASNEQMNTNIVPIVNSFITDVENPNITNNNEVIQFVQLYDNLVSSDTSLSQDEKDVLKQYFQIFKYSFLLWDNNIE